MRLQKMPYYLRSIIKLLQSGVDLRQFLYIVMKQPQKINLTNGLSFIILQPLDLLILKETVFDDEYRLKQLDKPKYIIDVGAGFGDTAIYAASLFPNCRVDAFEPNPNTFKLLQKNIVDNNNTNIRIYHYAVGTSSRYDFYITAANVMSSIVPYEANSKKITITGIPLANFINKEIDLLKIDCEGAEIGVLNSIPDNKYKFIKHIVLEYHRHIIPDEDEILTKMLIKKGYKVEQKCDKYNKAIGYLHAEKQRN